MRALARAGRRLAAQAGATAVRVRDRARAVARRVRAIAGTPRRRRGQAKAESLALRGETGRLLGASTPAARPLAGEARSTARALARSHTAKTRRRAARILARADRLQRLVARGEQLAAQIRTPLADTASSERLLSLLDPHAPPNRTGKLRSPTELGALEQLAELTPATKPIPRGFILPPAPAAGNPAENERLPKTLAEPRRPRLTPRQVALDGGFQTKRASRRSPRSPRSAPSAPGAPAPIEAHAATTRTPPRRRRGPHLAAQTPPRTPAQPPQRRPGQAHPERPGGGRLSGGSS